MSHFAIEPDTVAPVPGLLRHSEAGVIDARTLTNPDTGSTSASTAAALSHASLVAAALAADLDDLAARVDRVLQSYTETDGEVGYMHDLFLAVEPS